MKSTNLRNTAVAMALAFSLIGAAHAGRADPSEASALSMLPVAVSVAAPAMLLSGAVALTVVSVEATVEGTVWVLARASDGARMSVTMAASAVGGLSVAAGTAVTVSVIGAGWILSTAGEAIAFIPNEIGKALLYNERVTR